jgi:hypothetical protein
MIENMHIGATGRKARLLQTKQPRIFHHGGGGASWPGVVNVGGNRYYDADIVVVAEQIGTPITDNTTGESDRWLKVAVSAAAITDTTSIAVSYEDAPDPIPAEWPAGEYWFKVSQLTSALWVNHLTASNVDNGQFYGMLNGVIGFHALDVDASLPSGADAAKILYAETNEADVLSDLKWGYAYPTPGAGNLVVGGTDTPSDASPMRGYVGLAAGSKWGLLTVTETEGVKALTWVSPPEGDGPWAVVVEADAGIRFLAMEDYKYPTKTLEATTAQVDYVRAHPSEITE